MKKIILFFCLLTIGSFANAQSKKQLKNLDAYYEKVLNEWNLPGMAIAIVSGDKVVFAKGYGYANLEEEKKVNANTLFAIASNSKSFTAAAIAQLVDQNRLSWNDKVVDYLPYYRSYNTYVSTETTVADLLCHRSGLKTFSGDLLWYGSNMSSEEIITSAQYLEPIYGFREHYGYSNINFLAAGMLLEAVTDTSWADYVQFHFLDPLAMDRTLTSTNALAKTKNAATPYHYDGEENVKLDWVNWDNIAPAGALISSVNDYAEWIKLTIHGGVYEDKQFISERSFNEMTSLHIAQKPRKNTPNKLYRGYGLGWALSDYHGYNIVSHGGGYDGMLSKSCIVPEKELGFIILTNGLSWATGALMNKTLDVLLADDLDGKDWSADYLSSFKNSEKKAKAKQQKSDQERGTIAPMLFAQDDYVGTYTDKMYGDVMVYEKEGKLHFNMTRTSIFEAELVHWNLSIFTFNFNPSLTSLPEGRLWFETDKNGKIESLMIDLPNPDFYFTEFNFIKQHENN